MFDFFPKMSVPIMIGFLLGIGMVIWVQPPARGGQALLIVICIAICVFIRALWLAARFLLQRWRSKEG